LNVPEVGVTDNFFELGGDSILSIQVVSRAVQAGIKISTKQMYTYRTIGDLVEHIPADQLVAPVSSAEQGPITGSVISTPVFHWFDEQRFTNPHHFNQAEIVQLNVPVSVDQLERVFTKLLAHHDMLRARVTTTYAYYFGTIQCLSNANSLDDESLH